MLGEIDRLRAGGITPAELTKVQAQLRARFIYDADSVTDIAHQLGYFETIGSWRAYETLRERLDAVTAGIRACRGLEGSCRVQPDHRLVRAHQVTDRRPVTAGVLRLHVRSPILSSAGHGVCSTTPATQVREAPCREAR